MESGVDRTNAALIYTLLRQYNLFPLKAFSQPVSNYVGNYADAIGPGPIQLLKVVAAPHTTHSRSGPEHEYG